jgi:hypothetical protein
LAVFESQESQNSENAMAQLKHFSAHQKAWLQFLLEYVSNYLFELLYSK